MAGKKIQGGQLVFTIGDDGTLKLLEKNTKKAKKAMDDLGKGSQATDRRIKGVTQQSSNATKNFSKQAQTMQGGIVAVYATIAAQVFAVSAAFQFLKGSMEMRNLMEGQASFAATTGVAYRTLTHDIQAATGGMLQFKEAAQAAAIGTAAGLSAGQMEQIGVAAKNTSLALGRDLTDSFNRLTRGITKAEPELLDELGIVLRLEPAMKAYANSIQKNVKDLTQFEKSQAVANEVLEQAETKFGSITKIMDPSAFALQRFAVAFDEIVMKVQKGTAEFMIPLMEFASKNVYALVGALTLFLAPILKSILPDFAAMAATAQTDFGIAEQAADDAAMAFERAKMAAKQAGGDKNLGPSQASKDYMSKHKIKAGKGMPEGQLSKRQLEIRKKHLRDGVGFSKNMNKRQLADYKKFLVDQEIALAASQSKKQALLKRTELQFKAHTSRMVMIFRKGQMQMVAFQAKAAKLMNGAMRMMGWAGIILMIVQAAIALKDWLFGVDEVAKKEEELADKIKERYGGLSLEIDKMIEVQNKGLLGLRAGIEQVGSAFGSVDIKKSMEEYTQALTLSDAEERKDAVNKIRFALMDLGRLSGDSGGEIKALTDEMAKQGAISDSTSANVLNLANSQMAASAASKNMSANSKALSQSLRQLAGSAAKLPFSGQIENLKTTSEGLRTALVTAGDDVGRKRDRNTKAGENVEFRKKGVATLNKARAMQAEIAALNMKHSPERLAAIQEIEKRFGMSEKSAALTVNYDAKQSKKGFGREQLLEKAEERKAVTQQVLDEAVSSEAEITAEAEKQEKLRGRMLTLQDKVTKNVKQELALKIQMASKGMSTGVAAKQAQEDFKVSQKNLALKKAEHDLEMAMIAQDAITEDSSEEEKKAAKFLVEQKGLQHALAFGMLQQTKLEVEFGKLKIAQEHKLLLLKDKQAMNAKKRALAEKQNEVALLGATSHAEVRKLQEQKITHMQEKKNDLNAKHVLMQTQLDAFMDKKGHDEEEARKRQQEINLLIEDEKILQQEITAEKMKQNMADLIKKENLDIDSKRMKVGELTRGNSLGLGLGGITPQAVELNRMLAESNMTAADAEKKKFDDGTTYLDVLKKQADAQAGLNTELELANSTASILQNGFVSMFQAMIDGTKSFGDAMKDVMKQVLADLAAAYMRAAALKMLQAMGLPGLPGARYGGVMSPSGKSFAYGGIAQGPQSGYLATLHGNEAVIPLGNDRSVPVEMKGGGGSNVVNVTVNMNGQGQAQTSSSGEGQMQGLGRAIGGIVQQHLQQEMRPGGLLNTQGTKGRT